MSWWYVGACSRKVPSICLITTSSPLTCFQAAETGSGKTGAFGIPVLQLVSEIRRKALLGETHVPGARAPASPTVPASAGV